ncbi:MAG: GNAT family N-acetyltransferase [Nocardioidaceae bacterium]
MPSDAPQTDRLTVAGADPALDEQLTAELTAFNFQATGVTDEREFTVRANDSDGSLIAGLSGWTWGTCAGIGLVWVREDRRKEGWGTRLLEAAEREASDRGCTQIVVSSFTFQAPEFYRRHGYVETGRTEGLPREGAADVHFVKHLGKRC